MSKSGNRLTGMLVVHLNRGELLQLCYQLSVDPAVLPGTSREDKAVALAGYLQRHGRTGELAEIGRRLRPDLNWELNREPAGLDLYRSPSSLVQRRKTITSRSLAPSVAGRRPALRLEPARVRLVLLIMVALISICAVNAAWASQHALPGDILYGVKQLLEDGQRSLASSPRQSAELELKLAWRRLEELRACAQQPCGPQAFHVKTHSARIPLPAGQRHRRCPPCRYRAQCVLAGRDSPPTAPASCRPLPTCGD